GGGCGGGTGGSGRGMGGRGPGGSGGGGGGTGGGPGVETTAAAGRVTGVVMPLVVPAGGQMTADTGRGMCVDFGNRAGWTP
ncbi:hypothetical protein EIO00_23780, partial [Thermomonospora catenispora]